MCKMDMGPRKRKIRRFDELKERSRKECTFEDIIHQWNPQLESEFGPYLLNDNLNSESLKSLLSWDNLINRFLGWTSDNNDLKLSVERIEPLHEAHISFFLLLLETVEPEVIDAAILAGFFPFAIGLQFDSKVPHEDTGLVALELAGLIQTKNEEDIGGRIILHGIDNLIIGKRAVKEISKIVKENPDLSFSLSWSSDWTDINEAWEDLVAHHGINWLGYSRIRSCFRGVSEIDAKNIQFVVFRVNQEEVRKSSSRCVSLEIGYITGSCYTCLSNWSESSIPRIGQIRSASVPILLHQWGVRLFDVGVTAEYYLNFSGYHRSTREEFINLWRLYRSIPIATQNNQNINILELLLEHRTK